MGEHRRHEESHNPLGRIEEKLERLDAQVERLEDSSEVIESTMADFERKLDQILGLLTQETPEIPAIDFRLQQIKGETMGAITGVQAGSSDFFTASLIPANAAPLQSGPVFSTDDTLVTLTPDTANPFKVVAAVGASDTALLFNLKVDGVNSAGAAITHTFAIPITQAPPPAAVDFDLSQGA